MKTTVLVPLAMLAVSAVTAQTFQNQSSTLLTNSALSSGCAIGIADMNGDGLDDLVRLSNASNLQVEYQTPGGGRFTLYDFGNLGQGSEWSMVAADYDRNGYNDIIAGGANNGLKLLTADASGTAYTRTVLPVPPTMPGGIFLQGSNFADINNDGTVDFFGCHDDGVSAAYRGDGTTAFTYDLGLINPVSTVPSDNSGNYGSTWTDYDGDGDLDLYIAKCRLGVNDPSDGRRLNLLFQNDGNNNYTDVALAAGLRPFAQSWAADFADIDNDGDLDAVNISHDVTSQIYENLGNGTFIDITATTGAVADLQAIGMGMQLKLADFDNDGFVDLLITGRSGEHRLLHNNGDRTFAAVANPFPTAVAIHSHATGDLNRDGFLDVIATHATGYNSPSAGNPDELFINDGNANNWFSLHLRGLQSNINGIGARVEIFGSWGVQVREIRAGESYGIFHTFDALFGVGSASTVDSAVVHWPSGTVDTLCAPPINQFLSMVEGSAPGGCNPGCNLGAINPVTQLLAKKDPTFADAQMVWQSDANAGDYHVRYVNDRTLIPARAGNGVDVCVPASSTSCDHLGVVNGTGGTTWYYNVIGACNGNEAAN